MTINKGNMPHEPLVQPDFGGIYRTSGSKYLYISFNYFKERLRFPTDRVDTPRNRAELTEFMNEVGKKIRQGSFKFAKTFYWHDETTKAHFTELEGNDYRPLPEHVLFGEYAEKWMLVKLSGFISLTKQTDFADPLASRLIPHFKDMAFASITALVVNDFIDSLKRESRSKGLLKKAENVKPLSVKRVKHIIAPLKAVWEDACIDHNWTLRNPFDGLKAKYQEMREKAAQSREQQAFQSNGDDLEISTRDILLFREWQCLKSAIDPHYHVVLELLLHGVIGSEMEALQARHLSSDSLLIRCAVQKVRGKDNDGKKKAERHLKFKPKNWYRKRDIALTKRLHRILDDSAAKSMNTGVVMFDNGISVPANQFILTMKDGSPFNYSSFRKTVWDRALKKVGLANRVPYALRHTLVQWALLLGMTKTRLVDLMGHCDKTMIDRVYGRYRKGLVEEKEQILSYLGEDFLALEELKVSFPERYQALMQATPPSPDTTKAHNLAATFWSKFRSKPRALCG